MSTYHRNNGIESIKHESVPIKGSSKKNNADFNQPRPTTKWVFEQWNQSQNTTRDQGYIWQNVCQNIHIYYIYIRHMNFARSNVRIYVKIHDVKLYFKWNLPDPMSDSMSKLMSELMSEYLPECLSEGIYVWSLSEDKKIEDTSENMSEQISEYIYIVIRRSVWTQHMSACENVYMGSSFFSILARCCPIVS